MNKNVLLINDIPGYGKVAISAMVPILSHYGHVTYNLPTALVSNTLDYGKFHILDTTDYMKKSIEVWNELGFKFDCISTGFIVSKEQVDIITDYIEKAENPFVIVDPIMGDNGSLYHGVPESTVDNMRNLLKVSDIILPNFTEATFLTGLYKDKTKITDIEAKELVESLKRLGAKNIIISSMASSERNENFVLVYTEKDDKYTKLPFELIDVRFPGTGDIFSAVILSEYLNGTPLDKSVRKAMDYVKTLINIAKDKNDKFNGIPIEKYLGLL